MTVTGNGQENAAPSIHLSFFFPSEEEAILKMQKIKILQSALVSYFEVNWFPLGYTGLQQTPDTSYGKSNIIISSLWDPDTAGGVFSVVDYIDNLKAFKKRFIEGNGGWQTFYPNDWKLNTWYNFVNRAWESNGRLFIGTFVNDLSTGKWIHIATLSIPFQQKYLDC
jgi:hypothetical protein